MIIYFSLKYTLLICFIMLILGRFVKPNVWVAKITDLLFLGAGRMWYRDYVIGSIAVLFTIFFMYLVRFISLFSHIETFGEIVIIVFIFVTTIVTSLFSVYGENGDGSIDKIKADIKKYIDDLGSTNKQPVKKDLQSYAKSTKRHQSISPPKQVVADTSVGAAGIALNKNKHHHFLPLDDDEIHERELDRHIKLRLAYKKLRDDDDYEQKAYDEEDEEQETYDSEQQELEELEREREEKDTMERDYEDWEEENDRFERQRRIDHEILESYDRDNDIHNFQQDMYDGHHHDNHDDLDNDPIDDFVHDHMNDYHHDPDHF